MRGAALLVASACCMVRPTPGLTQTTSQSDKIYCMVGAQDMLPAISLCHDNLDYMRRAQRDGTEIVVFDDGVLAATRGRPALRIASCLTRADISLMCHFVGVGADE